jgi:hypothetical protein
MASIDDLVTVQKNGVVGVNALTSALEAFRTIYTNFIGTNTYLGASADTLVISGSGRLVSLSVTAAASTATITIYDAANVSDASTANELASIYTTATTSVGLAQINMPYFNGLVIKPAGCRVSITYSED